MTDNSMTSPFLTIEEAAAYLKVHANTIRGWLKENKLTEMRSEAADGIRLLKSEVESFFKPKVRS
jgi:excisionase family DNA binding protein